MNDAGIIDDMEAGRLMSLLRGEFDRLREEMGRSERLVHSLEGERILLREQIDAAKVHAEHEGESLRAMSEVLRVDAEAAARLIAEHGRSRARAEDLASSLQRDLAESRANEAGLTARVERLEREAQARSAIAPIFPILCSDLQRWSRPLGVAGPQARAEPTRVSVRAVPAGAPALPPSLGDIAAVESLLEAIRSMLSIPVNGQPYHTLFDDARFKRIQVRLRELTQTAERLISHVDRSRTNRDMGWHLMVAKRSDEIQRQRR